MPTVIVLDDDGDICRNLADPFGDPGCVIDTAEGGELALQKARRPASVASRESAEHFRLVADTAPGTIWVSGADKGCTYVNKAWLDFTGRPEESQLGDGWSEGVHADDVRRCLDTYVRAFDARQAFRMEYRLRRSDREYRWVLDVGVPRFASGGTLAQAS
jgi:PAS domain S-box-containing protein